MVLRSYAGVTGKNPITISDSDDESPPNPKKRKRGPGIKVEFEEDTEPEDLSKKFKERKSVARKRENKIKKKAKLKQKAIASGQQTLDSGSEEEMIDIIPEYITSRRKKFDKNFNKLADAGLLVPPDYSDIDLLDWLKDRTPKQKPDFPKSVEPSRAKEDIELPRSAGVIPGPIAQYLRSYQIQGVEFLHKLFVYQEGGILGDDMGLGKTVQVAAFLTAAFGKTGDERDWKRMRKMRQAPDDRWYPKILIICPGSLIENWKQELSRWGWWHVEAFHGADRDAVYESAAAGRLEIVITTYGTYRTQKDTLNLIAWDCVVADECHQLKDRKTAITKAMNEVNALCRIGLTGTAIQNKYEELWTLLNWTNPGKFGSLTTWVSSICEPLRMGQSHDATNYQLRLGRTTARKLRDNLLPPFFLRRVKALIADQLPKKTDHVVFCPLTDIQRVAYETYLASDLVELVKLSIEECDCGSGDTRGCCCYTHLDPPENTTKWQALVFPVIQSLQKLSNHLALMLPNSNDIVEKQQRDLSYLKVMLPDKWEELYEKRESLVTLANTGYCGKWQVLKKLLSFWHSNGDKVLIFSHSVRLLKILRLLFQNTSYNVSFLDGSIPYVERQEIVDDFNGNPSQFLFLISTKAGGVGLNITSANKVVIMDPNWNPSYDLQAQDRAYRIGQLRDVQVFRLVSAGTIEEIVYARQIYKQQQANIGYNASTERRYFKGVQNHSGQKGEIFGLSNLLTYHGNDVVLRDIVNKTNIAEMRAGVNMVGVDLDAEDEDNPLKTENNDENAAMSQLAAILAEDGAAPEKKGKKKNRATKKADPIQAILASAGVDYTHENSEVVGSSKVEAKLSSKAEEAGIDADIGEQKIFDSSQVEIGYDPIEDGILGGPRSSKSGFNYQYNPPEDVKKRQFCTMAKMFEYDSIPEFALAVEQMTQEERRDLLEAFYRKRRARLAELDEERDEEEGKAMRIMDPGRVEDGYERVYGAVKEEVVEVVGGDGGSDIKEEEDEDDDDDLEL